MILERAASRISCGRSRGALRAIGRRNVLAAAASSGSIRREVLSGPQRTKLNADDDRQWYAMPRFCTHVDDAFLAQVTDLYRDRIPQDAAVLDLMSSWVSHLPTDKKYSRVVGHGLNAEELAKNKQLDSFFVRNLNQEPTGWALESQSMDAVVCCVSVQYLQQPEKVFSEIYRVLKPGGVCIVTFSNRLFYEKAISAWRDGTGYGRSQLVKSYFQSVEGFTEAETVYEAKKEKKQETNILMKAMQTFFERSGSDPFYGVVAYRNFKRMDDR